MSAAQAGEKMAFAALVLQAIEVESVGNIVDDPTLAALTEALLDPADCWMTSGGADGIWCLEHDAPRSVTDPSICQDRVHHDAAMADLARKAAIGEAVEPWVRRMAEMECVLDSYADVRECVVHVSEWPWPNPRCEGAQVIAAALEQGG